ncbi:MAG TPA: hypothetical protein VHP14_19340, partial [Anaerolineales bacterium]|nr:hypothetical protein [Anaerolineales bacterium]
EHTRLLTRAIEWDKRQHENSYLLKGAEIDRAEGWQVKATGKQPAATEMQLDYILRSRKQQRIQQRRFTISIGVLLVLAVIAGVYAVDQAIKANISAQISQSNALASAALQPGNEDIAVALALEATHSKYAAENAYKALMQVVYPVGGIRYRIKTDENLYDFVSPAISPDGRTIAIKNQLYDLATGKVVRKFEDAPKLTLSGLFLPDGKRLILVGDRDVEEPATDFIYLGIYDANTGKLLQRFDTGIGISEVQLSADGKTLLAYQPDSKVTWWDLKTGKKLRMLDVNGFFVTISPDLKWLAEARLLDNGLSDLVITNIQTNQVQWTVTGLGNSDFGAVQVKLRFSNDSQELAVYGNDLATYSVSSGELIRRFRDSSSPIVSIRYSPDDTTLLTSSVDQTATLWDRQTGIAIHTQTVHRDSLVVAEYVNQGKQVVSMDSSGVIINWDLLPGNVERAKRRSNPEEEIVAISPDGSRLVAAAGMDSIVIFDAHTLKESSRFSIKNVPLDVSGNVDIQTWIRSYYVGKGVENGLFCYTTEAYLLDQFAHAPKANITIASLADGKIVRNWNADIGGSVTSAEISPTGDEVYIYYTDKENLGHFEAWNITSGKVMRQYITPYFGQLYYALDQTGSRLLLATAPYDLEWNLVPQPLQMIDTATGKVLFTWDKKTPYNMFFSPDGTQFALVEHSEFGQTKSNVTVYDAKTYKEFHNYTLDAVAGFVVHPNGQILITASGGGDGGGGGPPSPSGIELGRYYSITVKPSFRQWNFVTGELLWEFPASSFPFFSPDGRYMFNNWNSNLVMWRFDSHEELVAWACANRYVPEFTPQQRERFNIKNNVSRCAELEP